MCHYLSHVSPIAKRHKDDDVITVVMVNNCCILISGTAVRLYSLFFLFVLKIKSYFILLYIVKYIIGWLFERDGQDSK